MDKRIFILLLFSSIAFAQQSIGNALCDLQDTASTLLGAAIMILIILSGALFIPLVLIGLFFYFTKKDLKILVYGLLLPFVGIGLAILLVIIYVLMPYIISALSGGTATCPM